MPLHEIPGPAGVLEALLDEPAAARGVSAEGLLERGALPGAVDGAERVQQPTIRAAVVFAHPHPQMGGTMHTKVMFHAAKALARIGCAVLRFNFRGVGKSAGAYDNGIGELEDVRAGFDFMHDRYRNAPLWAGGMSFGSWAGMTAGARDPRVSTLIGIAMPVLRYDFDAVRSSETPKFFIHGERDEITSLKDMREFYARAAEPKELVVIDAADHLFDGRLTEVGEAVEDLLGDWP